MFSSAPGPGRVPAPERAAGPAPQRKASVHQPLGPSSHSQAGAAADSLAQPHLVLLFFRAARHVSPMPAPTSPTVPSAAKAPRSLQTVPLRGDRKGSFFSFYFYWTSIDPVGSELGWKSQWHEQTVESVRGSVIKPSQCCSPF